MRWLLMIGILLFAGMLAEARPVRIWTPKELCDKSDFVIIGTALSVEKDGEGTIQLGTVNPVIPTINYLAVIRVDHVICSKTEERLPVRAGEPNLPTIVFRYSNVDFKTTPLVNGPMRIYLEPDIIYVMYIKKDPNHDGGYVGALEGEFDDGQAVIRLTPEKPKVALTTGAVEVSH